ncbi:MAG: hypothetical protein HOC20_01830 [Chloroflexi bacterium]|nr:hypothetical protein [Chloroflexota bacterium]
MKSLKTICRDVDSTYFDTLLSIQQAASEKVHEQSYDGWKSKHLMIILSALREVLHEIQVVPKIREEERKAIVELKNEVIGSNTKSKTSKRSK